MNEKIKNQKLKKTWIHSSRVFSGLTSRIRPLLIAYSAAFPPSSEIIPLLLLWFAKVQASRICFLLQKHPSLFSRLSIHPQNTHTRKLGNEVNGSLRRGGCLRNSRSPSCEI